MEAIDTRAIRGIMAYLERRGFEILEESWAHGGGVADFIARDGCLNGRWPPTSPSA